MKFETVGSKSRSSDQILEKRFLHSKGIKFYSDLNETFLNCLFE